MLASISLLYFSLAHASSAWAEESPINRVQSNRAKGETIKALQVMNQGRLDVAKGIIAGTRDPLAAKLYLWFRLVNDNNVSDYEALRQFIRKNPEWPEMSKLRLKAESQMPLNFSAKAVVEWFDEYPPITGDGLDRYISALKSDGQMQRAKTVLEDWWASNTLSRDAQKKLFSTYKNELSHDAHRRRFDHMLYKGSYDNARGIARVLGRGYPALADARIALSKNKSQVNFLISKIPTNLRNDAGLMYERLRWRRKRDLDSGALQILWNMPTADKIENLPEWWGERHIMIRRLIEKKDWKGAYKLASEHKQERGFAYAQAEWLAGWLALRFLNEPIKSYQHFDRLYRFVKTPVSKARAAYWAGRASEGFKDKTISSTWYRLAAKNKTVYYGQLAAMKLGVQSALPDAKPPSLSYQNIEKFQRNELLQTAFLLHAAGMKKQSSTFMWAFVNDVDTPEAYFFAANKAAQQGMMNEAVRISKRATRKGMFLTAQSYPTITQYLRSVPIEWALVHGIIRQESMFDLDAKSHVGALGLMQLMPATAKEVARQAGVKYSKSRLTRDGSYNIKLGSHYLERLVDRFDGSYPMAIAAYNAGPSRVNRWIKTFGDPRKGEIDFIDWIELVPIYETRNYIQRVMEATYIYRMRLKSKQRKPSYPLYEPLVRG